MKFREFRHAFFNRDFKEIPETKILISTLNAYSFVTACKNYQFENALKDSHILLPDGISIVWAARFLFGKKLRKTAGFDLFHWEMNRLNISGGRCFFLGSSEATLNSIKKRAKVEYPNVEVEFFSPPFRKEFTDEESLEMLSYINQFKPDVLFVGMTAPKQETWASRYIMQLACGHICCIGAVFDFYAGNIRRAPEWMINAGMEWFFRLIKEPKRMWRRYLVGNSQFVYSILLEKATVNRFSKRSSSVVLEKSRGGEMHKETSTVILRNAADIKENNVFKDH